MSSEATHYVRRHVRGLGSAERMVLQTIADRCRADGTTPRGRGPSHKTIAEECESSERTIRRWVDALVIKGVLAADGRCTYSIPGMAEHDPYACGNTECFQTAETVEQRANQRAIRNRPEVAANHRASSSNSGQIWPRNRSEMAAKTFSLSERDLAPAGAQGFAQRPGAAGAGGHAFADDGHGGCTAAGCGLPKANTRHRVTSTTSTGDNHAHEHDRTALPSAGEVPADLRAGQGGRPGSSGSGQPPYAGDRGMGGREEGAGPGAQGGSDHGDRPSADRGSARESALLLPGGRVLMIPSTAGGGPRVMARPALDRVEQDLADQGAVQLALVVDVAP